MWLFIQADMQTVEPSLLFIQARYISLYIEIYKASCISKIYIVIYTSILCYISLYNEDIHCYLYKHLVYQHVYQRYTLVCYTFQYTKHLVYQLVYRRYTLLFIQANMHTVEPTLLFIQAGYLGLYIEIYKASCIPACILKIYIVIYTSILCYISLYIEDIHCYLYKHLVYRHVYR